MIDVGATLEAIARAKREHEAARAPASTPGLLCCGEAAPAPEGP